VAGMAWQVLGNGELVRATRTNEHADLFRTLPWSHGSLGFLVELELMVIPVGGHALSLSLSLSPSLPPFARPWEGGPGVFGPAHTCHVSGHALSLRGVACARLPGRTPLIG
jgi:hypothetical protein